MVLHPLLNLHSLGLPALVKLRRPERAIAFRELAPPHSEKPVINRKRGDLDDNDGEKINNAPTPS